MAPAAGSRPSVSFVGRTAAVLGDPRRCAGGIWGQPSRTTARALERLADASAPVPALEGLTSRELEIADGVALGFAIRTLLSN